jgi:hypothetical protein
MVPIIPAPATSTIVMAPVAMPPAAPQLATSSSAASPSAATPSPTPPVAPPQQSTCEIASSSSASSPPHLAHADFMLLPQLSMIKSTNIAVSNRNRFSDQDVSTLQ